MFSHLGFFPLCCYGSDLNLVGFVPAVGDAVEDQLVLAALERLDLAVVKDALPRVVLRHLPLLDLLYLGVFSHKAARRGHLEAHPARLVYDLSIQDHAGNEALGYVVHLSGNDYQVSLVVRGYLEPLVRRDLQGGYGWGGFPRLLAPDSHPYLLGQNGERGWIQHFDLSLEMTDFPTRERRGDFEEAFVAAWEGRLEHDGLNALVLSSGLTWREVALVRALVKYVQQTKLPFSQRYIEGILHDHASFVAGLLADEIGLDGTLAKRCGLLHDIGKAADHEAEGGHPKIGADLLKRYGESAEVVRAAAGHHDDLKVENPYTVLVSAADACSASRPGARRETLERYVKRMEELETIATDFPGVEQAFAIQAGREMRVIVSAKETSDETAAKVCRDIVKAFEERLTYPGEIKVTVLRETRHTEVAR